MLLILWEKIWMFNIAKARKYDKNANNDLYWLFGEFLRVLILQDRFTRPYLICVFIFMQFGWCDQSWLKFGLCGPTSIDNAENLQKVCSTYVWVIVTKM